MYLHVKSKKFPIIRKPYKGKVDREAIEEEQQNPQKVTPKIDLGVTPKNNSDSYTSKEFEGNDDLKSDNQNVSESDNQTEDPMISNEGWVPLFRKLLDSQVFQNEGLLKVWIWCLLKATHKEQWVSIRTGKGTTEVHLLPGQFIFGRKTAAKELKMSPSTAWKRITKLKNMQNLNIQSNTHYSIISVANWALYRELQKKGTGRVTGKEQPRNTYKNVKKEKSYSVTSIEVQLSELLLNLILERRNGFKKPDLQKWAKHIDLMIREDKRDPEEIEKVIKWCQADKFWQNNILSPRKLRKQFDQLALKMQGDKSKEEQDSWSHIPNR